MKPIIPEQVLRWLEKTYPLRVPKVTDTATEIGVLIGEQRVISKIRQLFEEQQKKEDL